jgi:hypothetical protein
LMIVYDRLPQEMLPLTSPLTAIPS